MIRLLLWIPSQNRYPSINVNVKVKLDSRIYSFICVSFACWKLAPVAHDSGSTQWLECVHCLYSAISIVWASILLVAFVYIIAVCADGRWNLLRSKHVEGHAVYILIRRFLVESFVSRVSLILRVVFYSTGFMYLWYQPFRTFTFEFNNLILPCHLIGWMRIWALGFRTSW